MMTLALNRSVRHRLGRNGKKILLERYDVRLIAKRVFEVYESLMQG